MPSLTVESADGFEQTLDSEIACRAAGILHYNREERGFEFLVREFHGNRHEAGRALGWSVTPDDLPALIPMMDDADIDVRSIVLGLLLSFDDERVLDWVLGNFHSYDDINRASVCSMKGQMIRYVSNFPNDEVLWLLRIQFGRDKRIRDYVARALSSIPNRDALPLLRQFLRTYGDSNFASILPGIARMGGREEVDLLLGCLERSKPGRQLHQLATNALQAITGENLKGEAWRAWWEKHGEAFDPVAARIKNLPDILPRSSMFFVTHFGNERSLAALRRELSERRDKPPTALPFAKALALQGDRDGLGYLLSGDLLDNALNDALAAVHEATGRGSRRSFWSMPTRWKRSRLREWREDFSGGGEIDTDWRRRMFRTAWERNRDALKLEPLNPALDETLARFPSVPEDVRWRLANPNGHVRDEALRRAGRAKAPWSAPVLKAMLNDRDFGVRCGAAMALSWLDDTSIADTMIGLLKVNDNGARDYASGWLGKHRIKRAMPFLIAAYGESSGDLQYVVAWALAQMRDDSLVDFFVDALASEQSNVRSAAVEGLSKLRSEAALSHLKKACADANESVRHKAVKAVFEEEGAESHAWFASLLQSPGVELRQAGLRGILYHKDKPFPRNIVWDALHDENSSMRAEAMSALRNWQIAGKEGAPLLQAFLRETGNGPRMRLRAAETLACRDDPLAITEVALRLKGSDQQLRSDAYHAMRRLPRATRVEVLWRVFASDKVDIDALSTAAGLVGSTKDRKLLRPIIQLLERGLDNLPAKRGNREDYKRWYLLKAICSSLKEITGREFIDPEAVSSERSEIEKAILTWWKQQPESRREPKVRLH